MIVASSAAADKSNAHTKLAELAEDLAGFVRRSVQDGSSLDDLERALAAARRDLSERVRLEPDERDPRAVRREPLGERSADAARRAGDQHALAAQNGERLGARHGPDDIA